MRLQRLDALEALAQEGGKAAIELDGGDRGARRQQAGRQEAEARPDLEDAAARRRVGLGQDGVEHVRVGQEVLRQGVAGADPGRPQRRPDGVRVDARRGGAAHRAARGSDGPRVKIETRPLAGSEPPRPGRPDHRSVVGAQGRSRHDQRQATGLGLARQPCSQHRVRRDAAAHHDRARVGRLGGPDRLGHEDVDDGVLEAPRQLRDDVVGERRLGGLGQARVGAGLGDDPAGSRLEAREAQVVRVAQPRPRKDAVVPGRGLGRPTDRRPARVAEPQQATDLVEGLAGGVVEGRAEQPVGEVVAHLGDEGVAAGHDQRHEREDRVGPVRLAGSRSHAA